MEDNKAGTEQLQACAERIAEAATALQGVLEKVVAQYEALNQKVDRIVAAIDERAFFAAAGTERDHGRGERKTVAAPVAMLLAKGGVEATGQIEAGTLDRALRSLSVDQRIAVKAEMARAGLLS